MKVEALGQLNRALQTNQVEEVTRALGREPGMRALGFEPGSSRWEWQPADQRCRNPFGFVYGGYLAVFVDTLLSSAIGTVLGEGEMAITADLKLEFLRPAAFALLRGRGRVRHKGSRVAFVAAQIEAENGEVLVEATSTWTVLRATAS